MPTYVTEDGSVERCRMGRTGDGVWYCTGHDFESRSERDYKEHKSKHHPIWCDQHGIGVYVKAACRYFNGKYYYDYCADHADSAWDRNGTFRERVERVPREANDDADRLPDDHPVEKKIREDAEPRTEGDS